MTGKQYYLTTLADWQRHASGFSNSHWFALAPAPSDVCQERNAKDELVSDRAGSSQANVPILVLVEADEGAHLALEDDPAFEALPHALAQRPISAKAQAVLASVGVQSGATTFDVGEALARLHPLLRHRVF